MNWHDLSVILAVAREGSFTGAGRVLSVAHTTVSRRISDIEKKLGVKLFVRTRSACIATDDCNEILQSIERMETEVLAIGNYFQDFEQKPRGLVKIAAMPWIIQNILMPAVPVFASRYSELELQFIADSRERSITRQETDISLHFELRPRLKEAALELGQFSYALYSPDIEDASKLRWVTFWEDSVANLPTRWIGQNIADGEKLFLRANDASLVMEAIRIGAGKGIVPDFLAAGKKDIKRLSGPKPEFVRTLKMKYRPDMCNLARIDAAISWLEETFADINGNQQPDGM